MGTGAAALLGLGYLLSDVSQVLVAYADTPLIRPESLLGLFTRHRLRRADLSILTAALPGFDASYDRVVRTEGHVSAIVASTDPVLAEQDVDEVNVGGYVAAPVAVPQDALGAGRRRGEPAHRAGPARHRRRRPRQHATRSTTRTRSWGSTPPPELAAAADVVLKRLFVPRKNTDTRIVFGTGGWRAVIGEGYTLANVRRLSQAIANETIRQGLDSQPIVVGGDRRFLSRDSAMAAAEVFAGNNIPVVLLPDDVPTPLVTFAAPSPGRRLRRHHHLQPQPAGVERHEGVPRRRLAAAGRGDRPLPGRGQRPGRRRRHHAGPAAGALASGMVVERGLTNEYVDAIERIIDIDVARERELHVIVDPMYGTSQLTLGMMLGDMRVRTEFIHAAHNPLFGGVAPAPDLERLSVLMGLIRAGKGRYALGLATDGDSDRIGIVDERGEYVSANDLLLLLYWYLHEVRGQKGGVVRNLATTHLLDRLAAHFGEQSRECKVGFKYVTAGMEEIDAVLGGESSGGLTIRGWILGKDGIFACALVVEMLARTGRPSATCSR